MRFLYLLVISLFPFFCLNCPAGNLSETNSGKIIRVSINETAIPAALFSNLTCRVGKKCSYQQINRDIHLLMDLGIFDDVIVTVKSTNNEVSVSYSFIESPIISAWTNRIYSCSLKPPKRLSKLNINGRFNSADWFNDKRKIKEFYKKNNYNNVTLSSRVEKVKGENKVVLFTDVYPGKKQFVKNIKITGANDCEKNEIESLLHFQKRNLWLFRNGSFSPDKFAEDGEKIRDFFVNSGFLDANVKIFVTNNLSEKFVDVNVQICKGPQYKLGTLIWNQQFLSSNDFALLKNEFNFPDNTAYTPNIIDTIREKVNKYCVKITPQQPDLTIVPIISQESEPYSPVIDIIITLRKARIGYRNSKLTTSTFSYPASLARAYLNK